MPDKKSDIKVSCAWGDGPDVLVSFDGHGFILYEDPQKRAELDKQGHANRGSYLYGAVRKGSFDLTRNQALDLAEALFRSAKQAKDMDDSYAEVENMENEKDG